MKVGIMEAVVEMRKEVEVDTRIAKAHGAWYQTLVRYEHATEDIFKMVARSQRVTDIDEMVSMIEAGQVEARSSYYDGVVGRIANWRNVKDAHVKSNEALREVEREYEGWSRFYLVPGGHVHSSRSCSSCNKGDSRTQFAWLPMLSGLTEEDAVASQGAILCTVCFPSAPVEWTNAHDIAAAARIAARCKGSGKAPASYAVGGRYGKCAGCDSNQYTTSRGVIRAHKKESN